MTLNMKPAEEDPACTDDKPVTRRSLVGTNISLDRTQADGSVVRVLDCVSVDLAMGNLICLRGRSGSGKTSLLHILAGMLRPTGGSVEVLGQDIWSLGDTERASIRRRQIAFMLQDGGLVDTLTSAENVALAAPAGVTRSDIDDALRQVGLASRIHSRPRHMSSGERQRVAFARSIIAKAEFMLIDEPTAALDRIAARNVIDTLRSFSARGLGILVASHDLDVIGACDQVVSLDERNEHPGAP